MTRLQKSAFRKINEHALPDELCVRLEHSSRARKKLCPLILNNPTEISHRFFDTNRDEDDHSLMSECGMLKMTYLDNKTVGLSYSTVKIICWSNKGIDGYIAKKGGFCIRHGGSATYNVKVKISLNSVPTKIYVNKFCFDIESGKKLDLYLDLDLIKQYEDTPDECSILGQNSDGLIHYEL